MNFIVKAFTDENLTYHSHLTSETLERKLKAYCTVPFKVIGPKLTGYTETDGSFTFVHRWQPLTAKRDLGKLQVTVVAVPNGSVINVCAMLPMFSGFIVFASMLLGCVFLYSSCTGHFNGKYFSTGLVFMLIVPLIIVANNTMGRITLLKNFVKEFDLHGPIT